MTLKMHAAVVEPFGKPLVLRELDSACGHCEYRLAAGEPVCAEAQFGGYTRKGGFAEYIVADPNYVAHVPARLAAHDAAPLVCAGIPTPPFDVVANCITIRGSFVGNRRDMAETLAFAADCKVKADIELQPLSAINDVFPRVAHGDVPSRVVLDFTPHRPPRPASALPCSTLT